MNDDDLKLPLRGSTLIEAVEAFRSATEDLLRSLVGAGEVTLAIDGAVAPAWVRLPVGWCWGRRLPMTLTIGDDSAGSRLFWPERCDPDAAAPVRDLVTGRHRGIYLGRPLAVTTGLRLVPGLHPIARHTESFATAQEEGQGFTTTATSGEGLDRADDAEEFADDRDRADADLAPDTGSQAATPMRGWLVQAVCAADLGPDYAVGTASLDAEGRSHVSRDSVQVFAEFLASTRPDARVLSAATRRQIAWEISVVADPEAPEADVDDALADPNRVREALRNWLVEQLGAATSGARRRFRTDRVITRPMGLHDTVAEAWYASVRLGVPAELVPRSRGRRSAVLTVPDRIVRAIALAADAAARDLARGRGGPSSRVADPGPGMTITQIESLAKASFVGYRGLAQTLRGRTDLRHLTTDWRGELCPVQTPESSDVGLVRHQSVSAFKQAGEWFDLSASAALIPFVNHDDPARASIGSKNLKQAVPVAGAEPPVVRTGWEATLAEYAGVVRSPVAGEVIEVGPQHIVVAGPGGRRRLGYGSAHQLRSGPDTTWAVRYSPGQSVRLGDVLAHAPDVVVDEAEDALLAYGLNAVVALSPYEGYNYEDGIVVSDALARRLSSTHLLRLDTPWQPDADVVPLTLGLDGDQRVTNGQSLIQVTLPGEKTRTLAAPYDAQFQRWFVDREQGRVSVMLGIERPLQVGDKLSNRHQGKGVVSRIVPADDMPRLPGGLPVEAILNPLGVLRRLNIGQLWETHLGLVLLLEGDPAASVTVGRILDDPTALADRCAALGAPLGRMQLSYSDGRPFGGPDGVVVGQQYLMKLDHLAAAKLSVRGRSAARSARSLQPTRTARWSGSRRIGAAQRMGEMELWALQAVGASAVIADAFTERAAVPEDEAGGVRPTVRSLAAHLRVAGLDLVAEPGGVPVARAVRDNVERLSVRRAVENLPELPGVASMRSAVDRHAERDLPPAMRVPGDPLYAPTIHGEQGTSQRELVRYAIPLPIPVLHPWRCGSVPDPLHQIPILPPAFRVLDGDELDDRYADLVLACRGVTDAAITEETPWTQLVTDLISKPLVIDTHQWPNSVEFERIRRGGRPATSTEPERTYVAALWGLRNAVRGVLGCTAAASVDPVTILGRVAGKSGLLRRSLLGQSVTSSARAVIVPDPVRNPETVGLPQSVCDELGVRDDGAFGDVIIVNRQPSLHPYNLVALRAHPVTGDAIHLPPLVVGALAGDFDGDTVAVHRPSNPVARQQAWSLLRPSATLRSGAGGAVLAKTDLDIMLGLTLLTSTAGGRTSLSALLGQEVTDPLRKSDMDELIHARTVAGTDPLATLGTLVELERIGWQAATGWSIGALELLDEGRGGHLAEAIRAGAAGKDSGLTQLLERRGALPGGNPFVPAADVAGCYLTGLTDADYFATAPAAIAALAEKKLTSPHAGALTKTLVEIADRVVIAGDDCGATARDRSPLTCRAGVDRICRGCYGPDRGTGRALVDGRRVGLLAALFIGERSTQLSMKVFQGGGAGGELGGDLRDLKALFGNGRTALLGHGTLERRFDSLDTGDDADLGVALEEVVDHAVRILGGVDRVHVQVVLRQLWEARLDKRSNPFDTLARRAERHGRPALEVATARGNVRQLGTADGVGLISGPRTALVLGKV